MPPLKVTTVHQAAQSHFKSVMPQTSSVTHLIAYLLNLAGQHQVEAGLIGAFHSFSVALSMWESEERIPHWEAVPTGLTDIAAIICELTEHNSRYSHFL